MEVGDKVTKNTGDYVFSGVIVAKFTKLSGVIRFVVENGDGILHIFSEKNFKSIIPVERIYEYDDNP